MRGIRRGLVRISGGDPALRSTSEPASGEGRKWEGVISRAAVIKIPALTPALSRRERGVGASAGGASV